MAKIRNAGLHQRKIHLDEVVPDAAGLCRAEYFPPIESALPYRHYLARGCGPALNVHRNKAAGVFQKIFGGIISIADCGHLKLELDELWIEKLKEHVIGPLAINFGKLEVLVVEPLHDPGRCCPLAHSVVFVSRSLDVIHGGILWAAQAWNKHLSQARVLCPGNAVFLIPPQFFDREMTADAGQAGVLHDGSEFGSFEFTEAGEPGIRVSHRRTQLDRLESGSCKLLECAAKVFRDHCSYGPCLTANGQAERIGVKNASPTREDRTQKRARPDEFSSRYLRHARLLA